MSSTTLPPTNATASVADSDHAILLLFVFAITMTFTVRPPFVLS